MIISGIFTKAKTVNVVSPRDGVHKATKRGYVSKRGAYDYGGRPVYYGKDCFYYQLDKNVGIKVFYSFVHKNFRTKDFVEKSCINSKRLYSVGLMKKVYDVETVELKINKIDGVAYAFKLEHVKVPEPATLRNKLGYPYDWNACSHPEHTAEGCKKYFEKLTKYIRAGGTVTGTGLQNVGFDIKEKKWFVLDGNIQFENIVCPLCHGKGYSNDGFEYEYKKALSNKYKGKIRKNDEKVKRVLSRRRLKRKKRKKQKPVTVRARRLVPNEKSL